MRVMSAGDGYRYLLASVAVGDGHRSLRSPLIGYYTQEGTPPGYWLGSGVAGLGESKEQITAGGMVTETHLRRLLGQGRDPITDQQLGRAYLRPKSVSDRISARVGQLDPLLAGEERAAAIERIEAEERERDGRRAVAGFDYTFSVPKSVSVLWALADPAMQERIVQAHRAAIEDVLVLMEREVAATRVGHNGVAQVAVRGLIATCYEHFDSRAGDPQLHTHVVIANKAQGEDGKCRSLDGRPLHAAVVALSEHYDALLSDRLARELGLRWEQRARGKDRNAACEIAGVPDALLTEFSSRSTAINAAKDELIAAYVAEHGHQPSTRAIIRLRQQATLATRQPKKTVHSLADLTERWRPRASAVLGQDATAWARRLLAEGRPSPTVSARDITAEEIAVLGDAVVEQVQAKRSTWTRWNLHAEASRQTIGLRFASTRQREALLARVVQAAEAASLRLTPPELSTAPAVFTRVDGTSQFRPRHADVYTSAALLAAEDRLLDLSRTKTGSAVRRAVLARLAGRKDEQGRRLSVDQERVVRQIAGSRRTLDLLLGPAGAGKTLTLAALRTAWEAQHGHDSVIGLAPSAAAAEVLAGELRIATENTAKWTHEHERGRWNLKAGQLVILDEASLAGTITLDQLTSHAARVGAKVLLVGDWAQLSAVDAGGAFRMLIADRNNSSGSSPMPELTEVRRFTSDWEKTASLRLRQRDTDVIDTYQQHDRIREGEHDQLLHAAYQAWRADTHAGKASILIAESSETVTALNERARADRVLAGEVSPDGAALHDGTTAGQGDTIITRRNDRRLSTGRGWVKNGDRWTVKKTHRDGSLTVQRDGSRRKRGGSVRLPAAYVAEHVQLGYAITAHRAQGATVDTAHLLVHSASMTREALYVAMTRGRHSNTAYVATDETHLEEHQHTPAHRDGKLTANTILTQILGDEGAELSAHETIKTQQDSWSSIAQLADEYETIAQAAQHDRFAATVTHIGLDPKQAQAIINGESFGSLIAALRRVEADGHQPDAILARAAQAGGLRDAEDQAAVLTARLAKFAFTRSGATRPRRRLRYLAGLIPQATGPMPADMRATLDELGELIEQRADALAEHAIENNELWMQSLGPAPRDPVNRVAWRQPLRTVAAYRDRYGLSGSDPLGPSPSSQGQRLDQQRAAAAARRAQAAADRTVSLGRAAVHQLDAGRRLGR